MGRHPEDDAGKPPDIRAVLRDEQQLLPGQGQAAEFGLLLGVAQAHVEIRLGEFRPEAGFEARKQRLAEAPFLGTPHARHDDGFALVHEAIQQEAELLAHGRPGGLLRLGDKLGAEPGRRGGRLVGNTAQVLEIIDKNGFFGEQFLPGGEDRSLPSVRKSSLPMARSRWVLPVP